MKTSPLDLRSQAFNKKMRGYHPDEVHAFLDSLAAELEEHLKQHDALFEKYRLLESQVYEYRQMENTLRETLMAAQRASAEMRENAKKEAELLIQQAQVEAQRLINQTQQHLSSARKELADLYHLKRNFLTQFRALVDAHRVMLEDLEKPAEEGAQRTLRFTRKSEVTDEEIERVVREFSGRPGEVTS